MKGIDIFCASQAATSISCLSMDDPSSSSTIHLGGSGRAIDRYNPIIRDPRRFGGGSSSGRTLPYVPSCSSQTPINPKPSSHSHQHAPHRHHHHQNNNGTTSAINSSSKPGNQRSHSNSTNTKKKFKMNNSNRSSSAAMKPPTSNDQEKKRSSDSNNKSASAYEPSDYRDSTSSSSGNRKSWSCSSIKAAAGDFISPPGSSRYLLSDQAAFFNLISEDFDPLLKFLPPVVEAEPPINHSKPSSNDGNNGKAALQKDDQSMSRSPDQVVVLRVSLHCRGCERKMRKHISRMEGVSSFNIDFAAKKVTVVGNVTPLEVLASISKVKNAQLWTPAAAAATAVPSFTHTDSSEINRNSQTTLLL